MKDADTSVLVRFAYSRDAGGNPIAIAGLEPDARRFPIAWPRSVVPRHAGRIA